MPTTTSILDNLREHFSADEVKTRQGPGGKTLDYVAIETVLGRLLNVAPTYSWGAHVVQFQRADPVGDSNAWIAVVEGHLTIGEKTAYGVGSMKHSDADMAVKSANSEAMKNAAKNGFGVGLELWDAEYRASLATDRAIAAGDPAALKAAVFKRFVSESGATGTPTADDVADHFNVTVKDLKDPAKLKEILGV
jgi:hypothetical protein